MPDQYLIHKLFAHALRPVKIEPFFLRAASAPKSRDITVATIMDPSRMDNFLRLVEQYHGPISVAVHVTENYNNVSNIIADLERVYRSHPVVAQRVDMHLVIDKYDRQFNLWRNVARFYARSDFILQLDVDFVIPTNMARTFAEHPEYLNNIDEHRTIYVLPAFEFAQNSASAASMEKAEEFPRTKERLAEAWHDNRIKQFHDFFPVGHKSTDYPRWFGSDEPYAIQDYSFKYEPYVVMKKDETPWCDERFVGYGANATACFFELFLAGYRFLVLPRDFVIHQRHAYPEEDRRIERNYNRELYRRFREEACVKYNLMWAEHGTRTDQEGIRASATRGEERIVEDYLGCNGLIGAAPPPPGYVPIEQCDVKDTWIKKQS
ncbi:glycosyl-transferase for dystroglycan-domain-containing protein [Hyaloraphidium curvatum]|nr:glycosyl-transferase for dystroglycan-domain-containing protein [Hyaloraphidium curvatum]